MRVLVLGFTTTPPQAPVTRLIESLCSLILGNWVFRFSGDCGGGGGLAETSV